MSTNTADVIDAGPTVFVTQGGNSLGDANSCVSNVVCTLILLT